MRKIYLCHVTTKEGQYKKVELDGILELKKFLRESRIKFSNEALSFLGSDCVIYANRFGTKYEIEMMPECCLSKEQDGIQFIPISFYCTKYKVTRAIATYAIKTQRLRSIHLGASVFIEDKAVPKGNEQDERESDNL